MSAVGDLSKTCADFRRSLSLNRRAFVRAGMLGAAGLTLPNLLRAEAATAPENRKRENSVIILWMRGGPSHIDTWDPKPGAPAEFRGEFSTISTTVPGIQLSDQLPLCAKAMDKWSIIRSLHYRPEDGFTDHSLGDQICFTGYPASRSDPNTNINPSCGSIAARQLQHLNPTLPAYVMVPRMLPGAGAGFLGGAYNPFETGSADPADPGPFQIPNFKLAEGLSIDRVADRRELLGDLDRLRRHIDSSDRMQSMDKFQRQAWEMLSGKSARDAFDLDQEPRAIREQYGFMPPFTSRVRAGGDTPAWSQRVLLARRLVEAGVRLVTVDLRWWDTHEDNFWGLKTSFCPRFDKAFSALIEDLDQRGLLASTLVVAWGEMGRAPRVNAAAGRDHYTAAFSAAIAGGGTHGGRVVGSTDDKAATPKESPKIPQDVLATVYRHLGINTNASYINQSGRPIPVLPAGEPIRELF